MLITALVPCLMRGRKRPKASGVWSGWPVSGLRAWRCRIEAPASAATRASRVISSGVMGRCGDMVGVWMAPVTAQVMMTFRFAGMLPSVFADLVRRSGALLRDIPRRRALMRSQRHEAPVAPAMAAPEMLLLQQLAPLALDLVQHRPLPVGAPALGLEE